MMRVTALEVSRARLPYATYERYASALLQLSTSQRERRDSIKRSELEGAAVMQSRTTTDSNILVVFHREDETKYEYNYNTLRVGRDTSRKCDRVDSTEHRNEL